ncbi:hypothetical protein AB0P13_19325 [Rhodococcus pyridinivorans]|uniref:hypothetical protein n=1 Tax=Rhodococcus pyridinivorans TaxID=103816 RepID=UPI00342226D9
MTTPDDEPPTIAQVVGRNARRLRGSFTANTLATEAQFLGLNWGTGRVADLEAGRVSPTIPTLYALAETISNMTEAEVSIADLLQHDGPVRINSALGVVPIEYVTASLAGERIDAVPIAAFTGGPLGNVRGAMRRQDAIDQEAAELPPHLRVDTAEKAERLRQGTAAYGETEQRIARDLGLDRVRMVAECLHLWGRTFSEERDHRAGPNANPQARGRISRELKGQLRASIESAHRAQSGRTSDGEG